MLDKALVKKHFSRHAKDYDQYADVQADMAKTLMDLLCGASRLARFDDRMAILEIGCGTGRLTVELLRRFFGASLTAVDLSPEMIGLARQRVDSDCGAAAMRTTRPRAIEGAANDADEEADGKGTISGPANRIQWIVGDAENDAFLDELSGRSFDLIVSGATFQWFVHPAATIRRLARLLKPGGLLAFSTFGPQTFRELRESFRRAERELGLPAVPHGQTFPSGDCWDRWAETGRIGDGRASTPDCRERRGDAETAWTMRKTAEQERFCVKIYPSVRAFMHCVKKMGAQNAVSAGASDAAMLSPVSGAVTPDPPSAGPMARPGRGLGGRKLLHRMEAIYAEAFGREGEHGIPATYHLLYKVYQKT